MTSRSMSPPCSTEATSLPKAPHNVELVQQTCGATHCGACLRTRMYIDATCAFAALLACVWVVLSLSSSPLFMSTSTTPGLREEAFFAADLTLSA